MQTVKQFGIMLLAASLAPLAAHAQDTPPAAPTPAGQVVIVPVDDPAETAAPATASPATSYQQFPDDFYANTLYGDIILKNDFASITFGVPKDADNPDVRAGSVLDLFTSPADAEHFEVFRPMINFQNPGSVRTESVDFSEGGDDGSASVTVLGADSQNERLRVDTVYEMQRAWPGVKVRTTVTNDSQEAVTLDGLADYMGWGGMGVFAPGIGWMTQTGNYPNVEFIFGRQQDHLVYVAPEEGKMEVGLNRRQTFTIYEKDVTLEPGESTSYSRWLLTGRTDPSDLFSFVNEQRGKGTFGYLAGRVVERVQLPNGTVQDSADVAGSEIRISAYVRPDLERKQLGKPYVYAVTDEQGHFQIALPPGEYRVDSAHPARYFEPSPLAIRVEAGKVSAVDHGVSKPSGVIYEVVDADTGEPIPAKLSFIPLRGTQPPVFGPPQELQSGNTVYTRTGKGVVDVPPGNYRVVASHGLEYHMAEERVRVQQLRTNTLRFELKRAFDSEGWIAADLGVLTEASPHSSVSARERLISAVAEGVQWLITADVNYATDLAPALEQLGLEDMISVSRGFRISSDRDTRRGDFLVFPVEQCALGAETDFTTVKQAATPEAALEALRGLCPSAVIYALRPAFPELGVLTAKGLDLASLETEGLELDLLMDVDAFQIWEGKRQNVVLGTYSLMERLMAEGYRLTPLGNSLSAGTLNEEPGYPRVYIKSSTDDPSKIDKEELVANIKAGKVQVTNGPFIRFTVNGEEPGSIITDTDGDVDVEVEVYAPNWANVSSISLLQNGRTARQIILPAGSVDPEVGKVFPDENREDGSKFRLRMREDTILTVIVTGDEALPQDPVNPLELPGSLPGQQEGQYSMAISAPVMIDVDGNGTFDAPLTRVDQTPEGPQIPPF